jgi:hypothetical protein
VKKVIWELSVCWIMDIKKIRHKGVDWIHLAQERDQCRDLMYTVMNLRLP